MERTAPILHSVAPPLTVTATLSCHQHSSSRSPEGPAQPAPRPFDPPASDLNQTAAPSERELGVPVPSRHDLAGQARIGDEPVGGFAGVTTKHQQPSPPPDETMNDDAPLIVDIGPDLAPPRPTSRNDLDLGTGLDGVAHG